LLLTGKLEKGTVVAADLYTLMFISESGFLRYTRLTFFVATLAAVSTSSAPGKEPNHQPAAPGQTTKLDTTTGFRGQNFGTSFSEFQGLTLEKDEGDLKLYTKKDENVQLGPVKLQTVIYHFFQDKFFAVSLHTETRDNTLRLLRVAQAAFGQGNWRPNAKDDLDQTWLGKTAEAFFAVNPKTEEGSLFIRDNQIGSQVEAYWDKLTNEAANDL
jgi:hypothetical protein